MLWKKNVAEDVAFVAVPIRRGAGDDDALRIDHFAHDAAGELLAAAIRTGETPI